MVGGRGVRLMADDGWPLNATDISLPVRDFDLHIFVCSCIHRSVVYVFLNFEF
jgi:hypothetical protein